MSPFISKTDAIAMFRIWMRLLQVFVAYFALTSPVRAVETCQQINQAVLTSAPRTQIQLREIDYCNMTNSILLIEKIIERRCLLTVWLERWHIGTNSVEVIKIAKLSDDCFTKDMRNWFRSIVAYPSETQSVLTEEVNKETEKIESMRRQEAWRYGDFIKNLDDGQRSRFYLRLFQCRARFNSIFENEFMEATK